MFQASQFVVCLVRCRSPSCTLPISSRSSRLPPFPASLSFPPSVLPSPFPPPSLPHHIRPGPLSMPGSITFQMYCTGGIRCDIYSTFLKQRGYNNLYTLEGGIQVSRGRQAVGQISI